MQKLSRKVVVAAVAALALGSLSGTALAHRGKGSGPKPMGTIASFDGTTLTVTATDGTTLTGTVTEDTKIKVEHRGHHNRGKGHGNPTQGSAEDLTAGTFVLKMKSDDEGTLRFVRIRSAAPHEDHNAGDAGDADDADDTEDPADATDGTDGSTDSTDGTDGTDGTA